MTSRSFGSERPVKAHLVQHGKGGVAGEVGDLRADVEDAFTALEAELDVQKLPRVRMATLAALGACTAAGSKVGKTLTQNVAAVETIDGVTPAVGDRVLVKNQVAAKDNGLYTVTVVGTGAIKQVLTRASDADSDAEMTASLLVAVSEGTQANTVWMLTTNDPIVLDTDALAFSQLATGLHAVEHIQGGSDEVDGDTLDVDFTPGTYTPTIVAPATDADHLTAHLAGIDAEFLANGTNHERAGSLVIDGDHLDITLTPTNYTPTIAPAEAAHVDDLAAHLGGIDDELGILHGRTGSPPEITAVRVAGGTLSADGSEDFAVLGTDLLQGQSFASITLGASLVITAEEPGVGGNAYDVEVVDTGGAGPSTVALVGTTLTIDLVGLTPTEDQIAALINVAAAAWTGLLRAHSGGGAAFGTVVLANLTGGVGAGVIVRAGNGVCTFVGQAGGGTTSDATASVQDTIIQANPPALTGLVPALQAADACAISVLSGTKSSQSVTIVLV